MEHLGLRTHFDFLLPMGFVDGEGVLHRRGEMRLATARDEIEPLRDPRVAQNDAYLTVLILARVITRIGEITDVTPEVVEGLFAADLAYLQDFYGVANFGDQSQLIVDYGDEGVSADPGAVDEHQEPIDLVEESPQVRRPMVEEMPVTVEA